MTRAGADFLSACGHQIFCGQNRANAAEDHDDNWVFCARNDWHLNKTAEEFPKIKFLKTKLSCVSKKVGA